MKKGLTLTVVLLIIAAVVAVVGFVQKGDVQKKLDEANAKLTEATAQVSTVQADAEAKAAELTAQVETLTADLEAAKAAPVVEAPADTYGLGMVTSIGSVADATAEKAGAAQVNTVVCSLVLDAEGKIKSVTWDVQQTKIQFSAEGKPVELPAELLTKLEKGEDYGMRKASPIGKEWFEQIAAFAEYCVGKTVEEVLATPTVDDAPAVEELKASVTVSIGDYLASLQKAAANAK